VFCAPTGAQLDAGRPFILIGVVVFTVVLALIFLKTCESDSSRNAQQIDSGFHPSADQVSKAAALVHAAEATGFIMKHEDTTLYVNREWYDMAYDAKRAFVGTFHASCSGRFVIVKDGYSGKVLATADNGRITIESQ